ncbi:MAG: hypothetical protein PHS32_16490 [Rhodoferax sp.]|uniref:hypothetical protein n=1 Tax=Rhodoferax sp. TaxID=50421 RepID=UPI0026111280|nr:hypothetical protein [Rhodoferax sp.]MDD5335332.1 hypothetical protein [Rhodoferax sp.]
MQILIHTDHHIEGHEAHLQGRPPMVVTQHAETLYLAVTGAGEKLNRMIEGALGRAARTEALPD